jgi:hypothetical protein
MARQSVVWAAVVRVQAERDAVMIQAIALAPAGRRLGENILSMPFVYAMAAAPFHRTKDLARMECAPGACDIGL